MLGGNPPRRASERSGRTDSIGWPARRSSSSPRAHHASFPGPLHPLQLWPKEGRLERLATRTRRMANWHRPTLRFQSVPHDGKNRASARAAVDESGKPRIWIARGCRSVPYRRRRQLMAGERLQRTERRRSAWWQPQPDRAALQLPTPLVVLAATRALAVMRCIACDQTRICQLHT